MKASLAPSCLSVNTQTRLAAAEFSDLHSLQGKLFNKLLAVLLFGLLLVVGLIGELAKSEKWKAHLRTFEVLVILGVAGELIGDGGIFVLSERLQAMSDAAVARLNARASEADERSKILEAANLKLRNAIAPRSLRIETERKIAADLRPLVRPGIKVRVVGGETPSELVAGIFNALDLAGFDPALYETDKAPHEIGISSSKREWETAEAIEHVFEKYGLLVLSRNDSLPPGSPITITVGERMIGSLP